MDNRINTSASELTVGICYPNAIVTEGIADVLERHNFNVVFRVAGVSEIYEACTHSTPDVIMVSTGSEGFCLDAVSHMSSRATVVIMVSNNMPEISVEEALKAGAGAIISTDEKVANFI